MLLPNFLLTLYSVAEQTNADIVHMSNYFVSQKPIEDNAQIAVTPATDEVGWTDENKNAVVALPLQDRLLACLNGVFPSIIYNKLIRRDLLTENNIAFESAAYMPEWIFNFQCMFASKNYIRIPHPLYIRLPNAVTMRETDSNVNYKVAVGNKTLLEFMNGVNFFANDVEKQNAVLQAYQNK